MEWNDYYGLEGSPLWAGVTATMTLLTLIMLNHGLVLRSKRCLHPSLNETHTQILLFCSANSTQGLKVWMTCF